MEPRSLAPPQLTDPRFIRNEESTAQLQKEQKYLLFREWLKKNGAIINRIEYPVSYGKSEAVGASTIYKAKPREALFSIPAEVVISVSRALQSSPIGDLVKSNEAKMREEGNFEERVLSFFIMHELSKGAKSFWLPYFNILDTLDLVSVWTQGQLDLLKDEVLKNQAMLERMEFLKEWKVLEDIIDNSKKLDQNQYSLDLYYQAWAIVRSRGIRENLPELMVIPLMSDLQSGGQSVECQIFSPQLYVKSLKNKQESYGQREERMRVDYKSLFSQLDIKWRRKKNQVKKEEQKEEDLLKLLLNSPTQIWELEGGSDSDEESQEGEESKEIQFEEDISWWKENEGPTHYCAVSCEQIKQESQIFLNRGKLSNFDLLLQRGVALINNRNESVNILLSPTSLFQANFKDKVIVELKANYLNGELLEYFRSVSLKSYKGKDILAVSFDKPSSLPFELNALNKAATALELTIKQRYPESYSTEIKKLIGGGGLELLERE